MNNSSKYIFLLIGKSGSGKSATGNSILGEKLFPTSGKGVSVTKEISLKTGSHHGYTVTAIDTPGVTDSNFTSDEAKSKSCTEMTEAMSQCPTDGKLAIVLVLKYGERFTEENRLILFSLKNIFGEKNLWKSCIIVVTYGDLFRINNEDDVTFESWLRDQEDELGELFKDCSYRCVLFNNRTKRPEESDEQFLEIVKITEELDQEYILAKFCGTIKCDRKCKDVSDFNAQEKKHYNEGGALPLQDQSRDSRSLKEEVDTRVELYELDVKATKLKEESVPYDYNWRSYVQQLELSTKELANRIVNNPALYEYQKKLVSLQSKLKELLHMIRRHDINEFYSQKIRTLTSQLNVLPIPSAPEIFEPYSVEANNAFFEVMKLNEEIGGLDELLSKIGELQKMISFKAEDSAVSIGWNKTSSVMGAVGAKIGFVPKVGLPLKIGLNALPQIGKTVHRQYLKHKNNQDQNKNP